MLWSLVKILFFIGIAAGLAVGAGMILETPGEIRIAFGGQERVFTPLGFLIVLVVLMVAVWIVLKLAGLAVAIVRTAQPRTQGLRRALAKPDGARRGRQPPGANQGAQGRKTAQSP